jgi:hypothetical protein
MKLTKTLTFSALLLAALFAAACEWEPLPVDTNVFDTKLRGTWVSTDPSVYSGTLTIENKYITISGFFESQTPIPGGDDNRRPFRDFTRGVPLKGYSEEGYIFIEDGGVLQSAIPYIYWEDSHQSGYTQRQFLRFNFGDRQETLIKSAQ